MGTTWQALAGRQCGVLSDGDLRASAASRSFVRNQIRSGRWTQRTHSVYTTTTGPLSREQRLWVAVAHAGPRALLGGLTATELQGMRNWTRDEITVFVDQELSFDPVEGVRFFRTRRPLGAMRHPTHELPTCRVEPAVLLFAGHEPSTRTALGAVTATVQQGLTTPDRLLTWTRALRPLRRAAAIRELLADVAGGSQSLAEIDVLRLCRAWGLALPRRQQRRRDRSGRPRYTDCEWELPDGRILVLEVDGAFHLDVDAYTADVQRHRGLTTDRRVVIRCTAYEVRHEPLALMRDLIELGVPRAA